MEDLLAGTLNALRLRGTVYFEADFRPPWGMAIPSKDVAAFHIVAAGACWLRGAGAEKPVRLGPGHIALVPQGDAHELVHDAEGRAAPPAEALERQRSVDPQAGPVTRLVCGHFDYDARALHPFFRSLPSLVHIETGEAEASAWLATAARLAAAESEGGQRGASAVVDRLAEALLLQTLRLYLDHTSEPRGFLAAVRDRRIGRALAGIHEQPGRDWTLAGLARAAGLSRSAFADRFRELVGETPMRYLACWRMLTARSLLEQGDLSTAEVAARVGYQSEFAFAKAFKRAFGIGPGASRRSA